MSLNHSLVVSVLVQAVVYGTPILFASLGELLAERSGVLNLGVEGMMLVGAVMGFWTVQRFHAATWIALLAAIGVAALAGAAMATIHAFLVVTLRASQIVSGLALTIFAGAAGLSSYLGNDFNLGDSPARHTLHPFLPSGMQSLPVVGPKMFRLPMPVSNSTMRSPVLSTRMFCSSTAFSSGRKLSVSCLSISAGESPLKFLCGSPSGSGPSDTMVASALPSLKR